MEILTFIILCAVFVFLYMSVKHIVFPSRLPPMAPYIHLLSGHTALFRAKKPHEILRQISAGVMPVFRLRFLLKEVVIISSYEAAYEALSEKKEAFAGRPLMDIVTYIQSEGRKNILFQDWSPRLKRNKQLVMQALARFATGDKIEEYVTENFTKLINLLPVDTPVDPEPLIYSLIFSTLSTSLFGRVVEFDDPELIWLRKQNDDLTGDFMKIPHPSDIHPSFVCIRIPGMIYLEERAQRVLDFYSDKVLEHLQMVGDTGRLSDIVDHLLDEMSITKTDFKTLDKNSPILLEIRQIVQDIFMAGTESTRNQVLWIILFLGLYPKWQVKLFEELQENSSTRKMQLIHAFISECQRCGTVSLMTSAHKTTCNTTLIGYELPENMSVYLNQYYMHHDPRHWDNPQLFNPYRFIVNGMYKHKTPSLQPFSAGLRKCAGESVARSMFVLLVCHFVRNYVISIDSAQIAERGLDAENWYRPSLFFGVPLPYHVTFAKR